MAELVRPSYAIPSIDQKDQPDVQPVEISGPITATIDGEVSLDDSGIIAEISLVVAAIVAGMPVTIAGQPIDVTVGNQIDTSLLATLANQLTELSSLASIDAGTPAALGQALMAASQPVVLASNQSDINVLGLNSLVPVRFDFVDLGYTGDNLTSAVFKLGGAGGTTVRTLALTYSGDVLDTVTAT